MYKGRYRGNVVAVKEYVAVSQARETEDEMHEDYEKDDLDKQDDAMFLFRYGFTVNVVGCRIISPREIFAIFSPRSSHG